MEPSDRLRRLATKRTELEADLAAVRPELADAIRDDARQGVRQIDIVKATGYTREMIRRIVRGVA